MRRLMKSMNWTHDLFIKWLSSYTLDMFPRTFSFCVIWIVTGFCRNSNMWGVGWFPIPARSKSLGSSWVSCTSAQFWHYLHRDSIRLCSSQTAVHPSPPSQDARCKPGLLPVLLTHWPQTTGSNNPPNSGCQLQVQAVACTSDWLGY